MDNDLRTQLMIAIEADNPLKVTELLAHDSSVLFDALQCGKLSFRALKSVEMAKTLLDCGIDAAVIGQFWSSGIGLNPGLKPEIGRYFIERGATPTIHVAAALGLTDILTGILKADASQVHARGGDGCTPLHFARNIETAQLLLQAGAKLDARDDDHDSTPAQWLIGPGPEVAAYLLQNGATNDIFLATALGDRDEIKKLISSNPKCVSHRIGKSPFHPIGHNGGGGTILQWTVGFNCYPHQVARQKGDDASFQILFEHSDITTQFLVACLLVDRDRAFAIAAANPGIVENLPNVDKELPAKYCWETNVNLDAVRLMLDLGFPIDFPETAHGYTPLHNAAWGGYGDLVDLLIHRGHPLNQKDPNHNATPLDFALHCCLRDGRHPEGEYARVVSALIDAGAVWDRSLYPTGNASIDAVLSARLSPG